MRDLLNQIDAALNANLYYCAVFSALSLPDICGAMESTDGLSTGARFAAWFDRYVAPRYVAGGSPSLSGSQCYAFRCSLLHQGRLQPDRTERYARIFFIEPSVANIVMHNNVMNDALNVDVRVFCRDIIQGVATWLAAVEGTDPYEANARRSIQRYPTGLAPFVLGMPVIG